MGNLERVGALAAKEFQVGLASALQIPGPCLQLTLAGGRARMRAEKVKM